LSSKDRSAKAKHRPRAQYGERQEQVTNTAARLFAERGFHATTISDLVQATGLQRGGLYHYIDGKDDLLVRIHEAFLSPLLAEAREIADSGQPPDVTLRILAQVLMRFHVDYHDHITVFLNEWRAIASQPAWKDIRQARREFEEIIAHAMREGAEQGIFAFSDARHARHTVLAWLGMINYSYQWLDPMGKTPPEQLADEFSDIFLYGICKRAGRAARHNGG
jgi:AcrR family transcriptional regulator